MTTDPIGMGAGDDANKDWDGGMSAGGMAG
jgi:hypothetical protein